MRKLFIIALCLGFLMSGSIATADNSYLLAKNDKVKKEKKIKKVKKNKQQPNQKAYENANPNARFKRYEDYTPEEKEQLKKKKWSEMTEEEKKAVRDYYKRGKDSADAPALDQELLEKVITERGAQND